MIDPKTCPPDQPYRGTFEGGRCTMERRDPGSRLPWRVIMDDFVAQVEDDDVSGLVPLVPAPRQLYTKADLDALPDNALVVDAGGRAWERWKHQWFRKASRALPCYATELVEHSPLQVVWTPDGQPIVNNSAPESDSAQQDSPNVDSTPDGLDLSWITDKPLPEASRDDITGAWYVDGRYEVSVRSRWTVDVLEDRLRGLVAIRERLMDEKAARDAVVEARAQALYQAICPDLGPFEDLTPTMRQRWLGLASDPDELRRIADMDGGE